MDVADNPGIGSIKSVPKMLVGILLVAAAIAGAYFAEQDTTRRYVIYMDGPGSASVLTSPQLSALSEGKLVYFFGNISTDSELRDRQLGVADKAIKFRRKVEVYQWKEDKVTGGVENPETGEILNKENYKYTKDWMEGLLETLSFKKPIDPETNEYRVNPSRALFESNEIKSSEVKVGDFKLPEGIIENFGEYEPVPVNEELLSKFPPEWQTRVKIIDGKYYIGKGTPENPVVGDYRISYEAVRPGALVTVVGRQVGNSIDSYMTKFNDDVMKIMPGKIPLDEMFSKVEKGNNILEWGIRAAIIIFILIGTKLFVSGVGSKISSIIFSIFIAALAFGIIWSVDMVIHYGLLGLAFISFVAMFLVKKSDRNKQGMAVEMKSKNQMDVMAVAENLSDSNSNGRVDLAEEITLSDKSKNKIKKKLPEIVEQLEAENEKALKTDGLQNVGSMSGAEKMVQNNPEAEIKFETVPVVSTEETSAPRFSEVDVINVPADSDFIKKNDLPEPWEEIDDKDKQ